MLPELTVKEHLEISFSLNGYNNAYLIKTEILSIASKMQLSHKIDFQARFLSKGEQRKLSIAMTLAGGSPKLIILDEPTLNLDVYSRESIWKIIRNVAS